MAAPLNETSAPEEHLRNRPPVQVQPRPLAFAWLRFIEDLTAFCVSHTAGATQIFGAINLISLS